jgi:hypothetical protein
MIISNEIIWLHLPKTGGTTLNKIFREIEGIHVDSDNQKNEYGIRIKHDSVKRREDTSSWKYSGQKKFITCRRLPDWLLSQFFFKIDYLNMNSDFDLCKKGLVEYSLRHNGAIKPSDWWVDYFDLNDVTSLRIDNLEEDINNKLVPYMSQLNSIEIDIRINSSSRIKNILDYFTADDIKLIYKNNPMWESWERKTYGNTYLEII